jgi:hypothetical protein
MASKGLPGFLRRSRRSSFNDSDDEEEEDLDASESNDPFQNNNNNSNNNSKQVAPSCEETTTSTTAEEQQQQQQQKPSTTSTADETTLYPNNNDSWKLDYEYEEQQRNTSDRQSSISTLGSGRGGGDENVMGPTIERKYSYRESQFEKTITNDVIKMSELRKLGWNGIPVSGY